MNTMGSIHGSAAWKLMLGIILVVFFGVGVAHVINPDYFI